MHAAVRSVHWPADSSAVVHVHAEQVSMCVCIDTGVVFAGAGSYEMYLWCSHPSGGKSKTIGASVVSMGLL